MAQQIIPLSNSPNQTFQITVSVDGQNLVLNLRIIYNESAGYWVLSVADVDNALILDSIPLVCGDWPAANILGQFGYLRIGSAYIIDASNIIQDVPSNVDLGSDFVLLWSDTAP